MTSSRPISSEQRAPSRTLRRSFALLLGLVVAVAAACQPAPPPPAAAAAASDSFTFSGSGWGHGVGMSQWGARGMAERGNNFEQILRYYYSGAEVASRASSNDLRVLAATQQSAVVVTAVGGPVVVGPLGSIPAGASVTFRRSGSNITVSGAINGTVPTAIKLSYPNASVRVATPGYTYRYGTLTMRLDTTGLRTIVGDLSMQHYLYGLGEMSSSWPMEAIKAQATASRTFAQKRRDLRTTADFDLYGSVLHQAYTGTKFEDTRWRAAVDSTINRVVTYNGALIEALYSASSGGHTENSEIVWVSPLPYLRGKPDPYDAVASNPHNSWSRTFTGRQLGSWFGLGTVTSVQILGNTGASGRVDKATIRLTGTGGSRDVSGPSFRSTVNANSPSGALMSTKFVVK